MDTFCEQLVTIKKDFKTNALYIGIWVLAAVLAAPFFLFPLFRGFAVLIAFGLGYGAYWLSSKLNVEFEYIITNDTIDIDQIINKSSRKRILSFDLPKVTRLEKYNPSLLNGINKKNIVFACNPEGDDVYFMVADRDRKGPAYLVFSPNNKTKNAIKKQAPRFVTNSVFND